MKPIVQRILGWSGLAIGLGGSGLFLLACTVGSPPPWPSAWWCWPVVTVSLVLGTGFILRRSYRRAPLAQRGHQHLRLSDLMVVVLSCGAIMGIGQAAGSEPDFLFFVLLAFSSGLVLTIGFVTSEIMRLASWRRYVFAYGLVPMSLGALTAGALVVVIVAAWISKGTEGVTYIANRVVLGTSDSYDFQVASAIRTGLCALPIGALLCWLALRRRPDK